MTTSNSFDKTDREYSSLASTDDPIRFWRSEVKVTADRGGTDILLDAEASKSIFY